MNILAFQVSTERSQGVVRLIVDNANKARKALSAAGLSFSECDVLLQELPHSPGALGFFAGKLARKGVNIHSAWGAMPPNARK